MSVELPPPGYPMVTRVISHPLFPGSGDARTTLCPSTATGRTDNQRTRALTCRRAAHLDCRLAAPARTGMRVVRMFADDGGVEVYSHDDQHGMRNRIPMAMIRLIEEAMPVELLADEISDAEGDEDEPDPDEPELDPEEPPSPLSAVPPVPFGAVPNGQATS